MSTANAGHYSAEITRALATPGGHLSIGRGGFTLHYDNARLEGYDCDAVKAEAIAAGLPVIDSRPVPFDKAHSLGLVHGYIRPFSPDEQTAIRIAHDCGISLTDLSAALNRGLAVVSKHAIRQLKLSFKDRDRKAPRTRLSKRAQLTLADILALGAASRPVRNTGDKKSNAVHEVSAPALVAGAGVPPASKDILSAMLAIGLVTQHGAGNINLLLPRRREYRSETAVRR
jgi:hypothetical protein